MKKVFLSTLMLITTFCLSAQKGKNSLQLNGGYGSKIESIGGGVQFNLAMSKKMEFAPSINQFAKKDGISVKEINLDLHYLIPIGEKVKVYPLFGFSLAEWSETSAGVNYGVGARYLLTDKFDLGLQYKKNAVSNGQSQYVSFLTIGYKL